MDSVGPWSEIVIGREFNFHNGKKGSALAIRITKRSGDQRISNVMKDGTVVINLAREIEDPNQIPHGDLSRRNIERKIC